ncbi:hypothetical protein [Pseudoxanthomonas sp. Soil82]|uniref:esterase/lipase family protein n=1 Tax=Pseudoxanthomonas sp. Soil82 TaxID=3157341 RepID=UPI00338DCA9C
MPSSLVDMRPANNSWHHIDETSDNTIVFVHGYFSNSTQCWLSKCGKYWPDLVKSDSRLPAASIFLGGYHTAIDSHDYGVQDCGRELIGALKRTGPQGEASPLTRRNILFICHSLGGIVVRYILEAYREDFSSKNIALCLIASPSLGSKYGSWLSPLSALWKNRAGQQLRGFNEFLEDLDDRFMRFLEMRPENTFKGAEAVEHKSPLFSRIPWIPRIVEKRSAGRYFGERRTLPRTDHSSIAKPSSHSHPSHEFLVDFLSKLEFTRENQNLKPAQKTATQRLIAPIDALFDVYDSRFEPFYLERDLDRILHGHATLQSLWLSGASGTGKTCALKRYIAHQRGQHFHLCLSQQGSDAGRQELLREFSDTFSQLASDNDIEPTFAGISAFLAKQEANDIAIYIDEVAANGSVGSELLSLLGELLTTWKQRFHDRYLLFTVSSLSQPAPETLTKAAKLHELFAFVESAPWTDSELRNLHEIISKQLPLLRIEEKDLNHVISRANGSPRYLKTLFRIRHFASSDAERALPFALTRTSEQLGSRP